MTVEHWTVISLILLLLVILEGAYRVVSNRDAEIRRLQDELEMIWRGDDC